MTSTKLFVLLLVGFYGTGSSFGQVQNNSIKDRVRLELDASPFHSTTAKSTVEWECINKALTSKCLVYHNDQWYYFSVNTPGTFYLNISSQQCRDQRGVQVIVIEGNPCETSTYRILQCIPRITNEETFISLGELKINTTYLIEMDGFLGDFCEFDIQIGTKPFGMPRETSGLDTLSVKTTQSGKWVQLEWTVPADASRSTTRYKVYKSRYQLTRFELEREVAVERNAYGLSALHYSIQDTIQSLGTYSYQVFGIRTDDHMPFLFGEGQVHYQERPISLVGKVPSRRVSIQLEFDVSTEYDVFIYEQEGHALLTQFKKEHSGKASPLLEIDFEEYINKGFASFLVLVVRANEKEGKEYYFTIDRKGMLKRN